ncbi:MAG: hypothetical protein RBS68_05545 [Anaerolineales bacterium]|jgi:hypothetical protein|nr:hypothetical protein [Anaerolineales bacterium]
MPIRDGWGADGTAETFAKIIQSALLEAGIYFGLFGLAAILLK